MGPARVGCCEHQRFSGHTYTREAAAAHSPSGRTSRPQCGEKTLASRPPAPRRRPGGAVGCPGRSSDLFLSALVARSVLKAGKSIEMASKTRGVKVENRVAKARPELQAVGLAGPAAARVDA
eukprot:4376721-Prymnesium_polylepis.1